MSNLSPSQLTNGQNGSFAPNGSQHPTGSEQSVHSGASEHESLSGDAAGPSNVMNGYIQGNLNLPHNERIVKHLYDVGFQMGNYADTLLHANQNTYRLHAIILARSPYFLQFLTNPTNTGGTHNIYVPLEKFPEITDDGFAVALGYLYSSTSLQSLNTSNARAVLAAACLLGGMDDLCHYAYQACRDSITVDTINEWVDFVDNLPVGDGQVSQTETGTSSVLGAFAGQLRRDVFQFLVVELPSAILTRSPAPPGLALANQLPQNPNADRPQSGREILLRIFSRVPFELFKAAVEAPTFPIGSDQERFRFAKEAIDIRKRTLPHAAEETVVLAFGGVASSSAVHITRKTRKRALFKVG